MRPFALSEGRVAFGHQVVSFKVVVGGGWDQPVRNPPGAPWYASGDLFGGVVQEVGGGMGLTHRFDRPMWDEAVAEGWQLSVYSPSGHILLEMVPGSVVCINGVALTVNTIQANTFTVGLPPSV